MSIPSRARWPRRICATVLLGTVAASALLVGAPVVTAADPEPPCVDGLDVVAPTRYFIPEAVLAMSEQTVLAAGGATNSLGTRAASIFGHDATGWHLIRKDRIGKDSAYMGLAEEGRRATWAVGYVRTGTSLGPLAIRRRSGGPWRRVRMPNPGVGVAALTDVDAATRGSPWAVGYSLGRPGRPRPWALRRDGGRWHTESPALGKGEDGMLSGVSSTTDGGTWVAGWADRGGILRPYIARREGGRWRRQELPQVGEAALADIAVTSPTYGWAVGYRLTASGFAPLVLRWDGSAWHVRDTSELETGPALLLGLAISDAGVLHVVGSSWDEPGRRFLGLAASLGDSGWLTSRLRSVLSSIGLTSTDSYGSSHAWVGGHHKWGGVAARTCTAVAPARSRVRRTRDRRRQRAEALTPTSQADPSDEDSAPVPRTDLEPVPPLRISGSGPLKVRDRTRAAGLPRSSLSWGAVIADFDDDGKDDIFLGGHGGHASLYFDRGATFKDSGVFFEKSDRHGCAAADVDNSGLPDLYCAVGGRRGSGVKANQLWLDPGGPSPALDPMVGGVPEPLGRSRWPAFVDLDMDGRDDLFLGQAPNRVDGLPSVNHVYLRKGPARFAALDRTGVDRSLGTWAVDVSDVDGDGRRDLLLVYKAEAAASSPSGVKLYRNTGGRFGDVTGRYGIRAIGEVDAQLVRLDRGRSPDLVQLSASRIRVSLQRRGRFVPVFERALKDAVATASGDVDGDGDTDLFVLRQKHRARDHDLVLLNRGGGRSFRAVKAPSRRGGLADDVFPIDHDQNGLTDFLVLNGIGLGKGPLQLIAFYR